MKKNLIFITLVLAVVCTSCKDFLRELSDVENTTLPDRQRVFANPNDYPAVVQGLWADWHWGNQSFNSSNHLSVAAEGISCSWGNWGMRESGTLPRIPFANVEGHPAAARAEQPWFDLNGVLANSNELLKLIIDPDNPQTVLDAAGNDITQMVLANTYAISGLSLGSLSYLFDQGYAATDLTDPVDLELEPSENMLAASIYMIDQAIAIANSAPFFEMTADYINGLTFTAPEFVQLMNSMKARILVMNARTPAETTATDWPLVLASANGGITTDFAPEGDGGNIWADGLKWTLSRTGWQRMSQRIISELADPADRGPGGGGEYPYPEGIGLIPPLSGDFDDRVTTDLRYDGTPGFPATRGYNFFCMYTYVRYAAYDNNSQTGPMNYMNVTENDLIRAEALIRTGGSKTDAAALINNTRVNRGGLAALTGTESDADLLDAIFYERNIELIGTNAAIVWADRRRRDELQPGTFPQMPVPARELNLLGLPLYSFP